MAISFRSIALGLIMAALDGALYAAGIWFAYRLGNLGAAPRSLGVPWALVLAAAAFVALSHVPERALPPTVTGTDRWVLREAFLVLSRTPGSWTQVRIWVERHITPDPLLAPHLPRLLALPA